MFNFIIKKVLYGLLVLAGLVVVMFFLFENQPNPASMILGQRADKAAVDALNKKLGRDKPLPYRFAMYVNRLSPISLHTKADIESHFYLDAKKYDSAVELINFNENRVLVAKYPYLGRSYSSQKKVSEIIMETVPSTAVLAVAAILFGTILGIILGVFAALKKGTFWDGISLVISSLGMSAPSFFMGILFAYFFAIILGKYTGLNHIGGLYDYDPYEFKRVIVWKNLILPALTLGIRPLSIIMQLTRSSLLEVLSQDYIRTAKAKGLSFYKVVFKHGLTNALNPVVTAVSGWFASLLAGAVLVERVFDWKGIGNEIVDALEKQDFPMVMGSVLFIAVVFIIINILVDIVYGILDPRVRLA